MLGYLGEWTRLIIRIIFSAGIIAIVTEVARMFPVYGGVVAALLVRGDL